MYARKFCGEQYDLKCVDGHFDFNARTVTDREIDSKRKKFYVLSLKACKK